MTRTLVRLLSLGAVLIGQAAHAQVPVRALSSAETAVAVMAAWPAAIRTDATALIDSASLSGLPVAPLYAKIVEGAAKGADPSRIVTVTRTLAGNLRAARSTLGAALSEAELVAAAGALQSGVTPSGLTSLRSSIRKHQSLTQLFVVLTDLTQRGIAPPDAVSALTRLARAGAGDAAFTQLRLDVMHDVTAGMTPNAAMNQRTNDYISRGFGRGGGLVPPASALATEPLAVSAGAHDAPTERGWASAPAVGVHVNTGAMWWRVRVDGYMAARPPERGGKPGLLDGRAEFGTVPFRVGKFSVDGGVGVSRRAFDNTELHSEPLAQTRISYATSSYGAWLTGNTTALGRPGSALAASNVEGGWWHVGRGVRYALSVNYLSGNYFGPVGADSATRDTRSCRSNYDPTRALQQYRTLCPSSFRTFTTGIGAATHVRRTQVAVFATGDLGNQGVADQHRRIVDVGGSITHPVTSRIEFSIQATQQAFDLARNVPRRLSLAAGIRMLPPAFHWNRDVEVESLRTPAAPKNVLSLTISAASSVEVRGDFTNWEPVALVSALDGTWKFPVPIAPGSHTFSVRIDAGAWGPPPGVPTASDGFGGIVGVFVVD